MEPMNFTAVSILTSLILSLLREQVVLLFRVFKNLLPQCLQIVILHYSSCFGAWSESGPFNDQQFFYSFQVNKLIVELTVFSL